MDIIASNEFYEISTQEDSLVLTGKRDIPEEGEAAVYHRREREAGTFRRIVSLPTPISHDKVTADQRDGVLTVMLPKAPEAQPTRVKVTTS